MINQFTDTYVNLCGDVPNPMSISEILGLMSSLNDLSALPQSNLNVNNIVCGMLEIPTMSTSEIFDQTCPGLSSVVGSPPNIQLLNTTFGCSEEILNVVGNPMSLDEIYSNLGTALLSFYPQGDNYASERKFISYSKWECIAYLLCIFAAFFVAYWYTSHLSIRLVKR